MGCDIPYIPVRLHTAGRPDLPAFSIGELLYRRSPNPASPFDGISLVDLSVNRQGSAQAPLCEPDDVLFNFNPGNNKGPRLKEHIVILEIKELTPERIYEKEQKYPLQIEEYALVHNCRMRLCHRKEECNYAHCAFEIFFDGVEMTFGNYKQHLGKHKQLRTWCKNELAKMIIKREVRINWEDSPDGETKTP